MLSDMYNIVYFIWTIIYYTYRPYAFIIYLVLYIIIYFIGSVSW